MLLAIRKQHLTCIFAVFMMSWLSLNSTFSNLFASAKDQYISKQPIVTQLPCSKSVSTATAKLCQLFKLKFVNLCALFHLQLVTTVKLFFNFLSTAIKDGIIQAIYKPPRISPI